MVGYSKNPLVKKLGIKENFKVFVKNGPANYFQLIQPLPENVCFVKRLTKNLDFVHFFTQSKTELNNVMAKLHASIKNDGMIWVSWPKRASNVPTDVTEGVIREVALRLGLVDVKVCAVDAVRSGLKLVLRRELR